MSEEEKEAIKTVEDLKTMKWYSHAFDNGTEILTEEKSDIDIVLNLIKKQQEEIEELKNGKVYQDYKYYRDLAGSYQANCVSKDKIKTKIEECRKILYSFEKELELKANKDKFIHKESMNCLLGQISILQSLLEKE